MNPPNYEIIKVLGSGAFGFVFEAYDHNNLRKVALKRIEKLGSQLSREFEILLEVKDSDHVVKILVDKKKLKDLKRNNFRTFFTQKRRIN